MSVTVGTYYYEQNSSVESMAVSTNTASAAGEYW